LALASRMRVQPSELDAVLRCLSDLDWIGMLQEERAATEPRHVLLIEPDQTLLGPLAERLLVRHTDGSGVLWTASRLDQLKLAEVLPEA